MWLISVPLLLFFRQVVEGHMRAKLHSFYGNVSPSQSYCAARTHRTKEACITCKSRITAGKINEAVKARTLISPQFHYRTLVWLQMAKKYLTYWRLSYAQGSFMAYIPTNDWSIIQCYKNICMPDQNSVGGDILPTTRWQSGNFSSKILMCQSQFKKFPWVDRGVSAQCTKGNIK